MLEISHLAGISLALLAAFGLGAQVVMIRKGTDTGRATDAVFIVTLVNIVILVPIVGLLYYPNFRITTVSLFAFIAAGISGTLFGRLLKYTSIERIGASRTAPLVSSNVVFGALIAVIVLDEVITFVHIVSIALIVSGVATISWETSHENPQNLSRRDLLVGLSLPLAAALFYGAEPTLAKIGFEQGTPALVGVVIKIVAAFLGFSLYLRYARLLPTFAGIWERSGLWYVGAGFGSTLFIASFYSALAIAPVVVIYPIIPTNILFVLVLSALFLPHRLESVTWKLVASSSIIVLGVILLSLYG